MADAIARGDMADLAEELGDLLLQVVYHTQMAKEEGAFSFEDVVDGITRKMIRRHPHVFGDEAARTAGIAKGFWDKIKAEEKAEKAARRGANAAGSTAPSAEQDRDAEGKSDAGSRDSPTGTPPASLLEGIPPAMPALTRAVKLQGKAAKVGFDWPSLSPVFSKLKEEIAELEEVALPADPRNDLVDKSVTPDDKRAARARVADELGDVLFVLANIARHLDIDPEAALRGTNEKFRRRFTFVERQLARQGRTPEQSNLAEMDSLWDAAKVMEREA